MVWLGLRAILCERLEEGGDVEEVEGAVFVEVDRELEECGDIEEVAVAIEVDVPSAELFQDIDDSLIGLDVFDSWVDCGCEDGAVLDMDGTPELHEWAIEHRGADLVDELECVEVVDVDRSAVDDDIVVSLRADDGDVVLDTHGESESTVDVAVVWGECVDEVAGGEVIDEDFASQVEWCKLEYTNEQEVACKLDLVSESCGAVGVWDG